VENYRFNKGILWTFLVLIPIAGIAALVYSQKDKIFGKSSFDVTPVQTSTKRIPEAPKKESPKIQDSIQLDSLNVQHPTQ